jgi:hypothetical protein
MQAAPGGDAGRAGRIQPLKRRRDRPVAFWSGVLDAGLSQQFRYSDSFNGSMRLVAVAVADDSSVSPRQQPYRHFVILPNARERGARR